MNTHLKKTAIHFFFLSSVFCSINLRAQVAHPDTYTSKKEYTTEIKKIASNKTVKRAFQTILDLEQETTQHHILLTEIPAPPFKEMERAKKFAEMIKEAGADSVWIDNVGNVIALRRGTSGGKRVVLEGHMDTVFPEGVDVTVKHRGDTLYAPGIGDDTRALAMLLTIVKSMEKAGLETKADVLFIGTVGEEGQGDLRGVKNLFSEQGPGKIDSYIAIDGGPIGGITHRGLGSHRYRITFHGPGGHSSGAFGTANPHNALGRAIHYWAEAADKFSREKGVRVTYNVGVIGGGTSVNSIPFESWMEVDMRSESPERVTETDRLLHEAVQKALAEENKMKQTGPDLTVDMKLIGDRPSGGNDPNLPLVQRAMATAEYLGAKPRLGVSSTNSNTPISLGVPAVTIGRGGKGGNSHALNEWYLNENGYLAINQALLLLLAEAGLSAPSI